jgi:hypothetical protein
MLVFHAVLFTAALTKCGTIRIKNKILKTSNMWDGTTLRASTTEQSGD